MVANFLIFVSVIALSGCATNPWSKVKTPSSGDPNPIGSYSAGCIQGARTLPNKGDGYVTMRLKRNRFYGHPDLIKFIEKLSTQVHETEGATLLIGDLGQARGGPALSGHKSHQTGLDVDIWFLTLNQLREQDFPFNYQEDLGAKSIVSADGKTVDPLLWTDSHLRILQNASESPMVDRIFVHAAVKKELCIKSSTAPWIQKIRPWWGHDDHFHVRLKCPANAPLCKQQEKIPVGNGCDETLEWWFSDEAKEELKKALAADKKTELPVLPQECAVLLDE